MRIASGKDSAHVTLAPDHAVLNGQRRTLGVARRQGEIVTIELDGRSVAVRTAREGGRVLVWCQGRAFEFRKEASAGARTRESERDLLAPMPGRVRRVEVKVGDRVSRGQVVLVMEAMKMEHAIRAPRDGVVSAIAHGEGDLVDAGVILAEIQDLST